MLGLVTIGQSPRPDVRISMFNERAPLGLLEAGALDELTFSEITALAPDDGDHPLVTRLRDGEEVVVAKRAIVPLLQAAVDRVEREGATVVCVLCTGAFPALTARGRLVFPDRILEGTVNALLPTGMIGVLMPHPGQQAMMERKWQHAQRRVVTAAVSPYAGSDGFADAARELAAAGAELIVMDCMGFDRAMQERVRAAVDLPVILANGLVGAVLGELVPSVGAVYQPG